jgi:hypothetical protein
MSTNSDIDIFITTSLESLLNFSCYVIETLDNVFFFSFLCDSVQAVSQMENSLFEWLCEAVTSNLRHEVSWQRPRVAITTAGLYHYDNSVRVAAGPSM